MIREAYCSTELSKILVAAGYHGDNINGLYVPGDEAEINEYYITLPCAMRWLREEKDIYLNIRVNLKEGYYAIVNILFESVTLADSCFHSLPILASAEWLSD